MERTAGIEPKEIASKFVNSAVHTLLKHAGAVPGVGIAIAFIVFFAFDGERGESLKILLGVTVLVLVLDTLGGLVDPLIADPILGISAERGAVRKVMRRCLTLSLAPRVDTARTRAQDALGMNSPDGVYAISTHIMKSLDAWDVHRLWIELAKTARIFIFLPFAVGLGSSLGIVENVPLPFVASWWFVPVNVVLYLVLRAVHQTLLYRSTAKKVREGASIEIGGARFLLIENRVFCLATPPQV